MAQNGLTMEVEYRFAWWLRWYAEALVFFCQTFGTFPDLDKFTRLALRAARFRVKGGAWRRLV